MTRVVISSPHDNKADVMVQIVAITKSAKDGVQQVRSGATRLTPGRLEVFEVSTGFTLFVSEALPSGEQPI